MFFWDSPLFAALRPVLFLLLPLLFAACTDIQTARPTDSSTPYSSSTATLPATLRPIAPSATAPKPEPAEATADSPTSTPTIQPSPAFTICSPLGWETLPELVEIVADPYKPPLPERAEERHHGVDFSHYARKGHASILGEPVQAVLAGTVAASISDRLPYGNMVIIETPQQALTPELIAALELRPGQSLYLLYAHMQAVPQVKLGENVACGQEFGAVGKTGYNIVNEHLHLETRRGPAGVRFESMAFYTTTATPEEMANYQRWRTGGEFVHFDPFQLLNFPCCEK